MALAPHSPISIRQSCGRRRKGPAPRDVGPSVRQLFGSADAIYTRRFPCSRSHLRYRVGINADTPLSGELWIETT
jgi:hypothetical protein